MNVDPKSTATMISGLVLCSIFAPYVYGGIKGIYRICEMAHFEKTESTKADKQANKQTNGSSVTNVHVSAVPSSPRRTELGCRTAKSAVYKRQCNTIRRATAPGACARVRRRRGSRCGEAPITHTPWMSESR